DRVRWLAGGELEFLGRLDDQVKVRGFRIEPGEVEVALRRHPGVADAVVVARDGGEAGARLVAYVVAAGEEAGAGELRAHLAERLPEHMVPSVYVPLAELPRTPAGKVDRRALPDPGAGRPELASPYVAPRGETEERLAALWGELLGVERVGAEDSFFALGGHSLLALRLISRVRETFGVEVPLPRLLERPTAAGLAAVLAEEQAGPGETPEELPRAVPDPDRRHEPFPLTDVQQAYWVGRSAGIELGGVATHVYLELEREDLDLARFQDAWNRLVRRHDMLRAVVLSGREQRILPSVPEYRIEVLDLRGAAPDAREAELAALRERLSHQVLPADRWPLFDLRATLLPGGATRVHVGFDLLIGDARSFVVLQEELRILYEDPGAELPPLRLSFRDYVLAADSLRGGERHRRSLEYWRARLPELPGPPPLPLAADPASLGAPRFVRRSAHLPADAWRELRRRAAAAGVTPSGVLLAAFADVLGRWSAATRFTLDLTLFRRLPLHPEVDRLVGDFTSISLLEVDRTASRFVERARAVQERLWADLDHAWASGVEVLRELARSGRGAPGALMPVVFTSVLDAGEEGDAPPGAGLGEVVHSVSQTPQVWLDHQAYPLDGGLGTSWDAVEALFAPAFLDAMFASYRELLERLAAGEGWDEEEPVRLPAEQAARRARANATAAPLPPVLLHQPFAE
ncbi:MAG TPA: condensation domain-containing protein, partial [Longimicrobiaceae bacterium]|nr:condensation domain-containing protein [Longimicrobiaceae bacterium]